jgi:hypothetical protein
MSKLLEEYLQTLEGNHLNEGVLQTLNKAFVLFGFGKPKDIYFKAVAKGYGRCKIGCWDAYPDEEVTTQQRSQTGINKGGNAKSDKDINREKEDTISTVKKNPDRGKCLMLCYHDLLKNTIEVIKKNRKTICDKNINKDLCEKWVTKYLPEMEAQLKAMSSIIDQMKKGQANITINKLKKIL